MRTVTGFSCLRSCATWSMFLFSSVLLAAPPVPRQLEPLPNAPLPAKTSIPQAKPKATIPAPASSRALPKTLPATTRAFGPRSPEIDPNIKPASATIPTSPSKSLAPKNIAKPSVELKQVVPDKLVAGSPAPIELIVTNTGSVPVDRVVVTDAIDAAIDVVSANPRSEQSGNTLVWSLGHLDPNETKKISFSVIVRKGTIASTAVARASVSFGASLDSTIALSTPEVQGHIAGPAKAMVGEDVELVIKVSNRGNSAASGVILRCILPNTLYHAEGPELEYEIGPLAAGEVRTVPLTVDAKSPGVIPVGLHLQADGLQPQPVEHVIAVEDYELAVSGEGPAARYVNQTCAYKLRVVNRSQSTIPASKVKATLPAGIGFAHASSAGQHDVAMSAVIWDIAQLAPGETRELDFSGVASQIGEQNIALEAIVGDRSVAKEGIVTAVKGVAALSVEVVDQTDPIEVNGETIYEIHIINQGTMAATNVSVSCDVPAEVEATAADGPTSQKLTGTSLIFDPMPELAPRAEAIFRVKCKGTAEAQARFKVTVKTDQIAHPITEEESTTIFQGQ